MRGIKNELFIEPTDGGYTSKRIIEFSGDSELALEDLPFAEGDSGNVIRANEGLIEQVIMAKSENNLCFRIRERPIGDNKLHIVTVSVVSGQLTVRQILNRRLQKKLVKIKSAQGAQIFVEPKH